MKDRANEIYKKVEDLKSIRGRSQDAILAACLYIACRQEDKPRTFKGYSLFQMLFSDVVVMPGSTLTGAIVVALCFGNGWGIIGMMIMGNAHSPSIASHGCIEESNYVCYSYFTTFFFFSDTTQ